MEFKTYSDDINEAKHSILNPGSDKQSGSTDLGGMLDVNRDGYVDVEEVDYEYTERNERLYGSIKSSTYSTTLYPESDAIPEDYERPIHLSLDGTRYHQKNTYIVTDYEAYKQTWYGNLKDDGTNNGFIASFASNNRLEHGTPLVNTGTNKIAHCDLTVWIEGWDNNVNDTILDVKYYLGMQFQIDRVD